MKNVIFISPNFPVNYWQFCRELRFDGVNVLGIGDQPYDELSFELKSSLTEYFRVPSLEDYDQVFRAVAYFAFRYGRIDFLESKNMVVNVRRSRGQDIDAACGQLVKKAQ